MIRTKPNNQQGMTLLIALIVLAAMTIIGVASMRDVDTQQNIMRNTQFFVTARIAAKTETEIQIDCINIDQSDNVIQVGLNEDQFTADLQDYVDNIDSLDDLDSLPNSIAIDIDGTETYDASTYIGCGKTIATGFEQNVQLLRTGEPRQGSANLGGFSMGVSQAKIRTVSFEFLSAAALSNSGTESIQAQGFDYILPGGN